MSNLTVCARFRPLSEREIEESGSADCFRGIDDQTFLLKDERQGELKFVFDRVFYEESEQVDVYTFLARPIVRDAVNGINGTIIAYGQIGAGKTYSLEGPSILAVDEHKKGLLPRVVAGIFEDVRSSEEPTTIKLSMVEVCMDKVSDLLDISKENVEIEENQTQGILVSGATEVTLMDPFGALAVVLQIGIPNRTNSGSHCVYIITIQQRTKCAKLALVEMAGFGPKQSLLGLGVLADAMTWNEDNPVSCCHSKLKQILRGDDEEAVVGRVGLLLCCCSPRSNNVLENLSTIIFGARAKLMVGELPRVGGITFEELLGDVDIVSTTRKCLKILEELECDHQWRADDVRIVEDLLVEAGFMVDRSEGRRAESEGDVIDHLCSHLRI